MNPPKSGYVAIIGKPNVGKSTLLNALIGKKISIVAPKPQTTRHQILGILTKNNDQVVFIDTPGLHEAERRAMSRYLNRLATSVIADADAILFLIDANKWSKDDENILQMLETVKKPVLLGINKIDKLKNKAAILPLIEKLQSKFHFDDIIPFSAKTSENLDTLEKVIFELMPEGEHLYPDDAITNKNIQFQVMEIIREKIIRLTQQELPYSTTVVIEEFKDEPKIYRIGAVIWVEREGQKPIVIGKNGDLLKKIGTQARKDIETLLNKKVFLRLWVKVQDNWTDNESLLNNLGFNQ